MISQPSARPKQPNQRFLVEAPLLTELAPGPLLGVEFRYTFSHHLIWPQLTKAREGIHERC